MSEIQDQINRILNDPEALRQVQSLGAQLGLSGNSQSAPEAPPAPPAYNPAPSQPKPQGLTPEVLGSLSGLAPLMQSFSANDEVSNLLNALRPFLGQERLHKLDQAQRIMRMVRLIPIIKDSGLFSL